MLKILLRHSVLGTWYAVRIVVLLVIFGLVGGVAFLHFWLLPHIERFHSDIELAASATLGRPLTIARIEGGWEGIRPSLLLSEVSLRDGRGNVVLRLPSMRNTVAWSSLLFGELRFHSLQLNRPELTVRRDPSGTLYVAGIQSDPQTAIVSNATTADWLLHQTKITISDGRVLWQDDMRGAPPIAFEQINLSIANRFNRHQFTLRLTPPKQLAAQIAVQGDLRGESLAEPTRWQGKLNAHIEQADVSAARTWIDLAPHLREGQGNLSVALQLVQGKLVRFDAKADLQRVRAQLEAGLPELDLRRLKGSLGWRSLAQGFELSAQELSLRMRDGWVLPPTSFLFRLSERRGYQSASGEVQVDALDLASISLLLGYLPVAPEVKQRLAAWNPQGRVRDLRASWQGDLEKLLRFRIKAQFDQLGMRQVGRLPGFSGLSGRVDGTDNDGVLILDSRNLQVAAPGFLAGPLQFDQLAGHLDWQRSSANRWELKLHRLYVANADLNGTIDGAYQINEGLGVADLMVDLTGVSVQHAARYIPQHAFSEATYRWLQTGLQGGLADTFQLRVRGDLRNFPFVDDKAGLFKITAKAKGVAIEFHPDWPRIEQAEAELLIHGKLLEVKAARARTAAAALRNVRVALPDTLAEQLVIVVDGEATDATQRSLDYIRQTPIRRYLNGFTDGFQAQGQGLLKLHLEIPLTQDMPPKVRGSYRIDGNQLDVGKHMPLLQNVRGELFFTHNSITAVNVSAQILGGPARLNLHNEGSVLRFHVGGTMNVSNLHGTYPYALLKHLQGKTAWQADVLVQGGRASVKVSSDLLGVSSTLPHPFQKTAAQKIDLRLEAEDIDEDHARLRLSYGEILVADLWRDKKENGQWEIRRGNFIFGKADNLTNEDGIWIVGRLPRLDLHGWGRWAEWPQRESLPDIAGIDVTLDQAVAFGYVVRNLNIRGRARNGLLSTRLCSEQLRGDLIWQPQEQGKLLVRLKQLKLGERVPDTEGSPVGPDESITMSTTMPLIDMAVDNLIWKEKPLGKGTLLLQGEAGDVVLKNFHLTNPDAVIDGDGRWDTGKNQTQINLRFELADSGKFLAQLGYPGVVSGAEGKFESALTWPGAPDAFNYPGLFGTIRVDVGKGRFLQVDPGAAKLLGVLSLQALPKRITLDFADVFGPGFQFDSISGQAVIESGVLKADNFVLSSSSAKVILSGEVDLQRETQQLRVRVFPAIGDNVSLLSFAAGPVVGVGVALANQLLRHPLDKLVSFDYNISGSWADPVVEKVTAKSSVSNE